MHRLGTVVAMGRGVPTARHGLLAACLALGSVVGCSPNLQDRVRAAVFPRWHGWSDRHVPFAGRCWQVRASDTPVGAGPHLWSASPEAVDLERDGLRLGVRAHHGRWFGAEVRTPLPSDVHSVSLDLVGPLGALDPQVVVGAFVYRDDLSELDIELSTWGRPAAANAQFAVAPPVGQRRHSFALPQHARRARLQIEWTPTEIRFSAEPEGGPVTRWSYSAADRPSPRGHSLHVNVWTLDGAGPTDRRPVEVRVEELSVRTANDRHGHDARCQRRPPSNERNAS